MFLFFSFYEYDASGGANDLIGKTVGDTWLDLTSLLDANLEAEEADREFPRRTDLLEYVQVLNDPVMFRICSGKRTRRGLLGCKLAKWFIRAHQLRHVRMGSILKLFIIE